ncbi:MAG: ribosome biogenesis GTPase YlqF [Erysipelotrichaceae bacterium]|nr:ribosome biogenesis GTPase YlqF [Erysipelotrichaceae bacterium]MDY5252694.1 ribosome biogenesis GTPase YlqF [Erysipelotrichaceae bacterium]
MADIQWFPGHMNKARRLMEESLKLVDMVIEIRDARIPYASANPLLDRLINNKPRLIVLAKKDLADPNQTKLWIKQLTAENTRCVAIDSIHENAKKVIINDCKEVMAAKIARMKAKGMKPRAIRAMVVGIPNVGKSTLINAIAKKKIAKVANKPGVTQALQWMRLDKDLELLDTPGVLWPKFDDQQVALALALCKAIKDEVVNIEDIAVFAMQKMIAYYPERLIKQYEIELDEDVYAIFAKIAQKQKLIKANDEIDYERTYRFFVEQLRQDKLGGLTWEKAA